MPGGARDFYFSPSLQYCLGTYLTSSSLGNGVLFRAQSDGGVVSAPQFYLATRLKISKAVPVLPVCVFVQ